MWWEVESLDIEVAVVAPRQFVSCALPWRMMDCQRGIITVGGSSPNCILFAEFMQSDHQNLWSTPVVLDLLG